jgi:release factor glutamine methyltransferase
MTVLEAIKRSSDFLARKGVESPRLHAELLLAYVLRLPRMRLYLEFERALTGPETELMRELVRRRGQREPLQQIVGSTSFCGFEIAVNRHVLVPRPETELLAEAGWSFLNGLRTGPAETFLALDWGTGSGCIAIALARKTANVRIIAVDASAEALTLARQNAAAHSVAERVEFTQCHSLQSLPVDLQCDLLVSNPPYIPSGEIEGLAPEVRDFEPRSALDGGPGGLEWPHRFACDSSKLLSSRGKLMLEFGDGQEASIRALFEEQNWIVEAILEDYTQRPRILIARPCR